MPFRERRRPPALCIVYTEQAAVTPKYSLITLVGTFCSWRKRTLCSLFSYYHIQHGIPSIDPILTTIIYRSTPLVIWPPIGYHISREMSIQKCIEMLVLLDYFSRFISLFVIYCSIFLLWQALFLAKNYQKTLQELQLR